ncbi:Putative acyltransferase [Mycobacteroides abscessus]|nr:Putative acyltransferase [Mycobacteroides abscessus]
MVAPGAVWPVYLVTMHLAALWVIFTMHVGHVPERIDTFDATNYVRQLFMVQLWFRPYFDLSSWNGPAWSISAEWLAYLLFGGLVLVIFRMAHATRARSLMVLAVLASLPPVMLLLLTGQFYTPWSWLPRIVMQFTAGALACAAVSRLKLSHRSRHVAGYAALLIVASIVGALYFLDAHPISGVVDSSGVVDVLFVPLVMALAVGIGPLPTVLSTRIMVYGGQISFGLYMVHELVHVSWTWATKQFELSLLDPGGGWIVIGLLVLAVILSMALYHWVEEPGRRWMRRMIGVTKPAITDHHASHNGHKARVPENLTEPEREPVVTGVTTR